MLPDQSQWKTIATRLLGYLLGVLLCAVSCAAFGPIAGSAGVRPQSSAGQHTGYASKLHRSFNLYLGVEEPSRGDDFTFLNLGRDETINTWTERADELTFSPRGAVWSGTVTFTALNDLVKPPSCPTGATCWVGPASGGLWGTASNWSNGIPTAGTNVLIDNGLAQASAVALNVTGMAKNLTVDKDDSLTLNNGTQLTIDGNSISNAGNILLNSTGNLTELVISSPNVILSGGGTVTLSNNAANYIFGAATTDTLTNQETIAGAGHIGNGQMTLVNSGTINANQSAGMTIQANGGATNSGTLEATAGAILALNGTTVTNNGGTISANGSTLQLINATINGGALTLTGASTLQLTNGVVHSGSTLNNSSTGTIEVVAGTSILGGTINNPAGGLLKIDNGSALDLENGTYSKLGKVTINSTGNITELVVDGANVTLSGGTVTLSNNAANYIFGAATTDTLTNQETIAGAGHIGNGQMTLVNSGTINANQSAGMSIQASGGFSNPGTLQVGASDTMHVFGGAFSNFSGSTLTGGSYVVAGALEIDQLGSSGGEIITDAAKISLNGASAKFVDAAGKDVLTNLAAITSAGAFTISGRTFTTAGNFTNNGSLTVGGGGKFDVNGNLSNFSGTTLTGGTYAVIGTLQFNGANIVNNAANITLTGASSKIVNQTQVDALANIANNTAAGSFTLANRSLTTAGSFTDAGKVSVSKGGVLTVGANGSYTQSGGQTTVDGKLIVTSPGQININAGSVFGNGGTFMGNVVSGGGFNIGDALLQAGKLGITGNYTQSSTGSLGIDIGGLTAGTQFDQFNISGAATLGGTLNLDLIKNFVPTLGSTFDIINFASETGSFATINGTHINANEHFQVMVDPTNITLDVVAGPDGLRNGYSASNFNTANISASATPEPSSLLLLGSGMLGGVMMYRKKFRNL